MQDSVNEVQGSVNNVSELKYKNSDFVGFANYKLKMIFDNLGVEIIFDYEL